MTLPRYLQVALVATVGAIVWSQFTDEEPASLTSSALQQTGVHAATAVDKLTVSRPSRANLFPRPRISASEQTAQPPNVAPVPTPLPQLPLHALGAWWDQHQRVVLLTDGVDTWPVCQQCNADGKIWVGSEPVNGWILKAVEQNHLIFEWQITHGQRTLELGDLQSEPKQ